MPTEADARMVIDQLLLEARWDIIDKSQVSTEEPSTDGRADYLLKNSRTQPLAVIEAKRFSIDPYSAKAQAKAYAQRRANLKIHRQGSLEESLDRILISEKFRFKEDELEVRPYQVACLQKVDAALIAGRRRMLSLWEEVFMGIEDGNRPNMNGTKLANLEIPFPTDLNEQRHIVEYLNGLRAKADDLKRLQAETDAELTAFTPALLAKAFRGEL